MADLTKLCFHNHKSIYLTLWGGVFFSLSATNIKLVGPQKLLKFDIFYEQMMQAKRI